MSRAAQPTTSRTLTRDEARQLADRVLALSKAEEATVTIRGGTTSHLRFARNSPTTSGSSDDLRVTVSSAFGTRTGSATVNQLDDAAVRAAVARSEEIARLAPEDPEFMPALGEQAFADVRAHDPETAERAPEAMARGVAVCTRAAIDSGRGLVAAGFTESSAGFEAIASSRGLFGYHARTAAYLSETVRTADGTGSGWASRSSHRVADIDYAGVSRIALAKAEASRQPRPLAPGEYPAILEPACVANLIGLMLFGMDARRAAEGRSYFAAGDGKTRLGEKLFPDSVTIRSDPADPAVPGHPWGDGGVPQEARDWIKGGVVASLRQSRYWAAKAGGEPVPPPSNVLMSGGAGTVDDLIAGMKRGVLVTSMWYIRTVDPRTLLHTGLTRDGVFWVENGKISHPVHNFRWNDSPISVLKNTVAMSAPARVPPRPSQSTTWMVPAIAVSKFQFSSASEAV